MPNGVSIFRFKCTSCGEWHEGMPTLGADAPLYFYSVPAGERDKRCRLTSDTCVVDQQHFFIRGCLELPVHGAAEKLVWGVWISLAEANFGRFMAAFEEPKRSHIGPFFGWLSTDLPLYPRTENLKTRTQLRNDGVRPFVELEPTDHPLALEQRNGVTVDRIAEIYAYCVHQQP